MTEYDITVKLVDRDYATRIFAHSRDDAINYLKKLFKHRFKKVVTARQVKHEAAA